jgi:hypothetical protein
MAQRPTGRINIDTRRKAVFLTISHSLCSYLDLVMAFLTGHDRIIYCHNSQNFYHLSCKQHSVIK